MNTVISNYIENMKEKIISSTCEVINIPSVFNDTDNSNTPFGKYTVDALEYVLNIGKSFGFRTRNIDNKCGYIEFGKGEKLLGIIGHLDVVPASEDDGWKYTPFDATVDDNKIYGRGAIDDKGPVIAALYAMKAVADNYTLDKRVRLILGLNEENDWKCIKRYKQTEEIPDISFSPDANFPCIYAEKTIESIFISQKYVKNYLLYIENVSTNNNAINVVPKYSSAVLGFDSSKITDINSVTKKIISELNYDIIIENIDNCHIKLISNGLSAHAAHPNLGVNALSKLLIVLNKLFVSYNLKLDILDYFEKYIGDDFSGKNLGINFKDESGNLTLNTAQFSLLDDKLSIGFNLRIPITVNYNEIEKAYKSKAFQNIEVTVSKIQEPLYIQKDNELVKKLCNIFNDYNKSDAEPEAIGGGTYARAFDNCVSFGPQMPGALDLCHQTNEYISIDNLIFCAKVYAEAIIQL